jgi:hypothetical protein
MSDAPAVPKRWREEGALRPREGPRRPYVTPLLILFGLAALVLGLIYLLRPVPRATLVPLWVEGQLSPEIPAVPFARQDRAALAEGDYFAHVADVPTPLTQAALLNQLADLQGAESGAELVIHLGCRARIGPDDTVQLLPADADLGAPQSWLPLRQVLEALKACPARRKLLILDIMSPLADPRRGVLVDDVAGALPAELEAVPDGTRFVLCPCSPGQVAHASEYLGRSAFGFYLEEGLRGWADGAGEHGTEDGRVTVRELAAFLRQHVDRWARLNRQTRQTPVLLGEGPDFPLTAVQDDPRPHLEPNPRGDYPEWLAEAWKKVNAAGGPTEEAGLNQQIVATLLEAERAWRAGQDTDEVHRRLTARLAPLEQRLQTARSRAHPRPASLALARAQGAQPDEGLTEAVRALLIEVESRTQGLAEDKKEPVRAERIKAFLEAQKAKTPFQMAWAAFEVAADEPAPAPDTIRFLDRLLAAQAPEPEYVETLFLRRLAARADSARASGQPWPTATVVRALDVVRQGERASAEAGAFSWVRDQLGHSAQTRHDAEMLFEAVGYAPAQEANQLFRDADSSYGLLRGTQETVGAARRLLDEARAFLPAYLPYVPEDPAAEGSWSKAADEAALLAARLRQEDGAARRDAGPTLPVEDIQHHTRVLAGALDELRRPLTGANLAGLIAEAGQPGASPALLRRMDALLATPLIPAEARGELWQARQGLAKQLTEETLRLDRESTGRDAQTAPYGAHEEGLLVEQQRSRALAEAARSLALLRVEGLPAQETGSLERSLGEVKAGEGSLASLGTRFRAAWATSLPEEIKKRSQREAEAERAYRGWLAGWFRYEAREHDGPGVDRLARKFFVRAARDYAPPGPPPTSSGYVAFAGPAEPAVPQPGSPVRQVLELRPVTGKESLPPLEVELFAPGRGWLAVSPVKVALPSPALRVTPGGAYSLPVTVELLPGAEDSGAPRPLGFLVRARLKGRSFHHRVAVPLGPSEPTILVSTDPEKATPALADVRLRPVKSAQPYYLYVKNPADRARQVVVRLGAGALQRSTPPLPLAAGETKKVVLPPPPGAAPAPPPGGAPAAAPALPELTGPLLVQVSEAGEGGKLLASREVPVAIASPREYVEVTAARFLPAGPDRPTGGRLEVTLRARYALPPPACVVEMNFAPGTVEYKDGTLRGVLPADGKEITLFAEGVRLLPGADEVGTFFLRVDDWERAFVFRTTFARQGSPTSPRLLDQPLLGLRAGGFGVAGPGYTVGVAPSNAPAGAGVEVALGRLVGGAFQEEVQAQRDSARQRQVFLDPKAPPGALALQASVEDWAIPLDTGSIRGPREVRARLLDSAGRELASATRRVVIGDRAPASVAFVDLPEKAWAKAPLPVKARGTDPVAGVKAVAFFVGKPAGDKVPEGVETVPGVPADEEKTLWVARLPLPADRTGPTDVSVRFVNGLGLSTFATAKVELTAEDPAKTAPATIKGKVVEGSLPQGGLTVVLRDDKGAEKGTATTRPNGTFEFKGVAPGKYKLFTSKVASGRKGEEPRGTGKFLEVKPGATVTVEIKLFL